MATTSPTLPAANKPKADVRSLLRGLPWSEMIVPVTVLCIVLAMIVPIPAVVLDVLISTNIAMSVIVLLLAMYTMRPVDFSIFPTLLLIMTLFRLALNVGSSRLILLNGNTGTVAAGDIIEAFGNFVVGGNYIVGVVIFLVLIAIQYVVINHGAVRISEVTARFTLDALPGKQMSIDADLNAGLIDEGEARKRRALLSAEAEFYGAMDGASRFTQRDAIASILITAINIIAGFLIGVLQHGMELKRALTTYTILTIGDGLVTVVPALMISVSGGLIVTRASADARLGSIVRKQMFSSPEPLFMASGGLLLLAMFPGLPKIPFLLLAGGVGYGAWRLQQAKAVADVEQPIAPASREPTIDSLLRVEPFAVEVGLGLVRFVDGGQSSPLLRRIGAIRKHLASELGYILPPLRVTDNLSLKSREYVVLLKGAEIARYELQQGMEMAIQPTSPTMTVEGAPTKDPAFGIPAMWIPPSSVERARQAGYTVVDTLSVMGTHLGELIRRHAHELFSRQDAKRLMDRVAEESPKAVEDLTPKLIPLVVVHKVLQNLLRERVSIRDGNSIVEALGEAATVAKNPVLLTEYVRQSLRRGVVKPYLTNGAELMAFFLDPALEQTIEAAIEHTENMSHLTLAPNRIRDILDRVSRHAQSRESFTVVLTSPGARYFLRQLVESTLPNLVVLSHSEVPSGVKVVSLGVMQ